MYLITPFNVNNKHTHWRSLLQTNGVRVRAAITQIKRTNPQAATATLRHSVLHLRIKLKSRWPAHCVISPSPTPFSPTNERHFYFRYLGHPALWAKFHPVWPCSSDSLFAHPVVWERAARAAAVIAHNIYLLLKWKRPYTHNLEGQRRRKMPPGQVSSLRRVYKTYYWVFKLFRRSGPTYLLTGTKPDYCQRVWSIHNHCQLKRPTLMWDALLRFCAVIQNMRQSGCCCAIRPVCASAHWAHYQVQMGSSFASSVWVKTWLVSQNKQMYEGASWRLSPGICSVSVRLLAL